MQNNKNSPFYFSVPPLLSGLTFSLARPACFCTDLASSELLLSAIVDEVSVADSLGLLLKQLIED